MELLAKQAGKLGCCKRGACIHRQAARMVRERLLLAKLAADTPQFFNPAEAIEAKMLRDRILEGK